ncbi:MAG: hypothetical protein ACK2UV_21730 [Candidatus Promineifilaceae bacterium]
MKQEEQADVMAASFGEQVRYYRRQCGDPMRGGMLTQDRLGELIGEQMGDAGYTGAAVSEWERGKSKIHADDRLVLIALLAVLVRCGGLAAPGQANSMLAAGNYRRMDDMECAIIFGAERCTARVDSPVTVEDHKSKGAAPPRREKQLVLLDKVNSFWVKGVLEKSLEGAPIIEVPHVYRFDAIDHPWAPYLGEELITGELQDQPASMRSLFNEADQALLILGYPGSGKTTTLIALADELITQARADWTKAVPVILDLASWAGKPQDLAAWAVEELAAKYQIPRRYGRKWIAANELILLLDGLDNLALGARRNCIKAINAFRISNGLTGLAVCCRGIEYHETGERLTLKGAIELLPLDDEQLTAYLAGEAAADTLQEALDESPALWELARSPLMLNLMTAVYGGQEEEEQGPRFAAGSEPQVETLLDVYVRRSFDRHPAHVQYSESYTMAHLSWLARQMNAHNQAIFLIEQVQPSWLPGRRLRRIYMILSGLITGLAGGLIMWLLWRLLRLTLPQLPIPVSTLLSSMLGVNPGAAELLAILAGNLALGLLLGLTLLFLFERRTVRPDNEASITRMRRRQVILIGLETGLATMLFILLFAEPLLALAWGVAEGFMYAAAARFIFGWNYRTEVRTVEALAWSWPHAATGAVVGLALALTAEIIESLLYGYNGAIRTVATLVVAGFVLGGLRGRAAERKSRPNQGVWLSLRNAFAAALVLSVTLAVLAWIIRRNVVYAWQIGLLSAVIAAAMMGASVFIKHFLLRALLRYKGLVPWRFARFLDHASQQVLMRKVGNGYIFTHSLVQDYFAALD